MEEVIINEEWRTISGYPNYQVSNLGRLRNQKTDYILNPSTDRKGYLYAGLWNYENGKSKCHKVHKLVAQEFIQNPDNKPLVGHIDAKARQNNNINNLRWHTHSEHQRNIKGARQHTQDFLDPSGSESPGSGSGSGSSTK